MSACFHIAEARALGADHGCMRILFITYTRIGDAVLSTGLLDHVLRRHPGIGVTVVCGPVAAPLFTAVPGLERIIPLEKRRFSTHWLGMWSACWRRRWDMVIDLRNTPWSYLLAARRRCRMGRPRDDVHRVVSLGRVLGLEARPPAPHIWTTDAELRRAASLIPEGAPVLAVGPTANWAAKTWRAAHFVTLIESLTGPGGILEGARVAIFAHADERDAARPVIDAIPPERRLDFVGRLPLLEVYACLQRAALYVGNDSGLMHLAAAAGIPTLGLFGPSREELYAPWGEHSATVRPPAEYQDLFPAGFDHRNAETLMDGLTPDAVATAAAALWRRLEKAA